MKSKIHCDVFLSEWSLRRCIQFVQIHWAVWLSNMPFSVCIIICRQKQVFKGLKPEPHFRPISSTWINQTPNLLAHSEVFLFHVYLAVFNTIYRLCFQQCSDTSQVWYEKGWNHHLPPWPSTEQQDQHCHPLSPGKGDELGGHQDTPTKGGWRAPH